MSPPPPGASRASVRTRIALVAGAAVGRLSRALGRGRGSVIGGTVTLRLDPGALQKVSRGRSIALVTGTNGKSTASRFLTAALASPGEVAHNDSGSNMPAGLLSALSRHRAAPLAVLETDEAYLGPVVRATRPRVVVLLNLSREYTRGVTMARTLRHWRDALAAIDWPCTVVANVDDPNVAWATEGAALDVVPVAAGLLWEGDAVVCAQCDHRLHWDGPRWSCPSCGRRRPEPAWSLSEDGLRAPDGAVLPLELRLPGRGARSGAVLAVAAASTMGADPEAAAAALVGVDEVDGRYAPFPVGTQHEVSLHLAKNPAGWAAMVGFACDDPAPVVFVIERWGPKDTAALWDAPIERLAGRRVFAAGERRLDIALCLEVGGARPQVVADPLDAVRRCPPGRVTLACNYPGFIRLRRRLGD